jgi:SNF2 family DNA or RNA helicase
MERFDMYIEKSGMEKKSYQRDGVEWLFRNELNGATPNSVRGGFVADEMGLGKTIMMIGLCLVNFKFKTLIVVPPVLIQQWYLQILKTTGHKCMVYHGTNKKKIDAAYIKNNNLFEKSVIVLCTYEAISVKTSYKKKKNNNNLQKQDLKILHNINWGRIIFDEAHHLRNRNTGRFIGAKNLNCNIKWLVSGTPIQNKKQDFYALCSLLNLPKSYYSDSSNYSEIKELFILKRTKKSVGISLEDAVLHKEFVTWNNKAEELLAKEIHSAFDFSKINLQNIQGQQEEHLNTSYNELVSILGIGNAINKEKILEHKPEFIHTMLKKDLGKLPLLLCARQSCIYPKMMFNKIQKFKNEGLIKDVNNNYQEAMTHSSKLDAVVEAILLRKNNGNGKLVFCHFKEEMTEIAKRLKDFGGEQFSVAILDGQTKMSTRMKLLTQPKDVLIMQIQTGCEGLNLQEFYSEIYFVSAHWNPFVEDQAIARCHRIGQNKNVFVWRFEMDNFTVNTKNLEEYIADVQQGKRNLVSQIIE